MIQPGLTRRHRVDCCVNDSFTSSESADCGRPEQPLGSLITLEDSGQAAAVRCQEGWLEEQEGQEEGGRLRCNQGRWRGTLPVCRGEEYLFLFFTSSPSVSVSDQQMTNF